MNREEIQEIILRVLSEGQEEAGELPLDFAVEVSARHVHLTEEAVGRLFGPGAKLTPKRSLSQPGQFLCEERVAVVTPKGRIENVAVLGPARKAIQTELSVTDCRTLGIQAPLRMSGELQGAADVYLVGPAGMIEAKSSAIVAQAHIHITPEEADQIGIANGQSVSVTLGGERPVTLNNVICRVSSSAALAMHIDYDEANACMLPGGAVARMTAKRLVSRPAAERQEVRQASGERAVRQAVEPGPEIRAVSDTAGLGIGERLITEEIARSRIVGRTRALEVKKGVLLTPSAKDVLCHAGIELVWRTGGN